MSRSNLTVDFLVSGFFVALLCGPVRAETVIYVDSDASGPEHDGSSWCSAFTRLDDGLGIATAGDTILVANGTYTPDPSGLDHPSLATFQLIDGVVLQGGYAGCGAPVPDERDILLHETILSGDLNGDDEPREVIFNTCCEESGYCGDSTCKAAVCAVRPSCCDNWDGRCGSLAQFYCCDICRNPTKCDNSFHVVTGSGTNSSAVMDGFVIVGGEARGGLYYSGWNDDAYGGGMYNVTGSPTVINCVFLGNGSYWYGAGVYSKEGGTPAFESCSFIGNVSDRHGGGMFSHGSSPTLHNCLFSGNRAGISVGGMFCNYGCQATMVNCTFGGNYGKADPGGIVVSDDSSASLVNCILWDNLCTDCYGGEAEQIQVVGGSVLDITYTFVQEWTGLLGGTGNSGDDPRFMDPTGADGVAGTMDDDLRLRPDSPCINAGSNAVVSTETDLDGNPRINLGVVDVGAYEHQVPIPALTTVGMLILTAALVAAGVAIIVRRQKTVAG